MNTTKTAKTFLIIAAIMQLIYFISAVVILKCPSIVLFLCGHSGGYDLPFDSIRFGGALVSTILFVIVFVWLFIMMNTQKKLNVITDIAVAAYTYITYFVIDIFVSYKATIWLNTIIFERQRDSSSSVTIGENVAGLSYLNSYLGYAKVLLFTAIVLMIVGYVIYRVGCSLNKDVE